MTDKDQARGRSDDVDLLLDKGLARYAEVEPREGLEDRILANLRAERPRVSIHAWWKWGVAALTAMVLVAAAVAFRPARKSQPVIGPQTGAETQSARDSETQLANPEVPGTPKRSPVRRRPAHRDAPVMTVAAAKAPKLDQFPSPRPLTEQEKMLLGYIEQNPQHAALLAEARMDSLRHDAEEQHRLEMENQRNSQ
ncbi:MAG TPA: hypothetical protein VGG04_08215 [Candidatus Sulfotelmatobacter sp.]|jgi:hypothetical protein